MSYTETKDYWEGRALEMGVSPQATTNDYYMRQIEIRNLKHWLRRTGAATSHVGDVGCGNGYSTLELASEFPEFRFSGFDYSQSMIESANALKAEQGIENVGFHVCDLTADELTGEFDVLMTDRVMINLPTWEEQAAAIDRIWRRLKPGGSYFMIENFTDGQTAFNAVRESFGLDEIPVRDHNLFIDKELLHVHIADKFDVVHFENISSVYYLVSRVVYSKICQDNGDAPDYYDDHHKWASMLPSAGDMGPIQLYVLSKNSS
ncbi:MAG: class I SAM-dependent methyltransferase [Fuerstiella sp.]|nr:class I SAM-dependent methyltransferase [Fuerstiella sp.]MCP4858868.1 class I SAM-dependent methyltransferase [Fuerstiella sp.]